MPGNWDSTLGALVESSTLTARETDRLWESLDSKIAEKVIQQQSVLKRVGGVVQSCESALEKAKKEIQRQEHLVQSEEKYREHCVKSLEEELDRYRNPPRTPVRDAVIGVMFWLGVMMVFSIGAKFDGHQIHLTPGENSAQLRSWRWWGFSDTWTKIEWKVDREYSSEPGWYLPGGPIQFGAGDRPDGDFGEWNQR